MWKIPAPPLLQKLVLMKNLFLRKKANAVLCPRRDREDCSSCPKVEFNGEICLHFKGGLETLDKPLFWAFPQVRVCLECGSAQFSVPESKMRLIQQNL
jgi:hypothetical protein